MRYFLAPDSSRPFIAGGFTFTFEPVQNRGGSWLGVLAVADEAAASALASAGLELDEVSEEKFNNEKKKLTVTGTLSEPSASPRPQRVLIPGDREEGVRLVEQSGKTRGSVTEAPKVEPVLTPVAIETTNVPPPVEPLLDSPSLTKKRFTAKPRT